MPNIRRIAPCLWFDRQGEEAAKYYVGIFNNSRITAVSHFGRAGFEAHRMPAGTVMTVAFELDGQPFTALNGGPQFKFTEAVSLQVMCETQAEVDYYWEKLAAGGDPKARQCGWVKDKFGLSWQIVPTILPELIQDPHTEKTERVITAIMEMKKLDIAALKRAHEGK